MKGESGAISNECVKERGRSLKGDCVPAEATWKTLHKKDMPARILRNTTVYG